MSLQESFDPIFRIIPGMVQKHTLDPHVFQGPWMVSNLGMGIHQSTFFRKIILEIIGVNKQSKESHLSYFLRAAKVMPKTCQLPVPVSSM